MASTPDQAAVDAALQAALNDLDDEDSEDEGQCDHDAVASLSATHTAPRDTNTTTTATATATGTTEHANSYGAASIATPTPRVVYGPPRPPPGPLADEDEDLASEAILLNDLMQQLLQSASVAGVENTSADPDALMNRMLQEMQSQMTQETSSDRLPSAFKKASKEGDSSDKPSSSASPSDDLDAAINNLVQGMASSQADIHAGVLPPPQADAPAAQQSLDDAFKGFSASAAGGDWNDASADALMDGVMEQLLSKDLMYEPMKQVADRFPQWLRENQMYISQQEYNERRKQSICFQRLIEAYEKDPSNTKLFMELMQEAQEFGQPPTDLLKDIAPDLELDDNGMPKLDGMAFPSEEECIIM